MCDDMRDALHVLLSDLPYELSMVDIDQDPALLALYDELVPVLFARKPSGTDQQLCHYFLDAATVKAFYGA